MIRLFTRPLQPRQPSDAAAAPTPMQIDGGEGHDRQITGEEASEEQGYGEEGKEEKEKKKKKKELGESNLDGLCCSICMEPWASQGDHQASCLPCGHVYGMSCIIKWIQQCHGHPAKCPHCNAKCISKDVRKLFASPVVVHDEGLQKVTMESQAYHKSCFKCSHGGCPITPSNYAALEGILYCKHHFSQLIYCICTIFS